MLIDIIFGTLLLATLWIGAQAARPTLKLRYELLRFISLVITCLGGFWGVYLTYNALPFSWKINSLFLVIFGIGVPAALLIIFSSVIALNFIDKKYSQSLILDNSQK